MLSQRDQQPESVTHRHLEADSIPIVENEKAVVRIGRQLEGEDLRIWYYDD